MVFRTCMGKTCYKNNTPRVNNNGNNGTIILPNSAGKFPSKITLKTIEKYKKIKIPRGVQIKQITNDIDKLKHVKEFNIYTDITNVRNFTVPSDNSLEILRIKNMNAEPKNNIYTILKHIVSKSPNLKHLEVSNYKLDKIPDEVFKLENLEKLYVQKCNLKSVSDNISKLTKLNILDFKGNELQLLPETFGNLKELKTLNLYQNPINTLPKSINKMKKLKLILMNEPRNGFNASVLKMNNNVIFQLYNNRNRPFTLNPRKAFTKYRNITYTVNNRTQIINSSFSSTNKIGNIPVNRRAFINTPGETYNNGKTIRRLYDLQSLIKYLAARPNNITRGSLIGGNFHYKDITPLKLSNSGNYYEIDHGTKARLSLYLRNARNAYLNSQTRNN